VSRTQGAQGDEIVLMSVRNTGRRQGADVLEAYVSDPAGAREPPRQLAAFARVTLSPGQRETASMTVLPHSLMSWNTTARRWELVNGWYRVLVETSERHIVGSVRWHVS
jgi:beta-glucosidase